LNYASRHGRLQSNGALLKEMVKKGQCWEMKEKEAARVGMWGELDTLEFNVDTRLRFELQHLFFLILVFLGCVLLDDLGLGWRLYNYDFGDIFHLSL